MISQNLSKITYLIVGVIEVLIGLITLIGVAIVQIAGVQGIAPKPMNVYIFVVVTAAVSFMLGAGMVFRREWARKLLIFFSGYIVLTKILKYGGLMVFSGDIVTAIPPFMKDGISFLYHALLIFILSFLPARR